MTTTPGSGLRLPRPGVGGPRDVRRRHKAPVVLALLLSAITVTDAAAVDRLRSQRAADLAADRGKGAVVQVERAAVRHAVPVSLRIPRLRVTSPLVPLRKLKDGRLQVPTRYDRAGWYVDSARPGDAGPTVLAGHVDSTDGPGVFFHLAELKVGDLVLVDRADRTRAAFTVTRVIQVAKRRFPTAQVYGGKEPGLRLITCGGSFDPSSRHYRDNVIVFAQPRGAA